ncbi:MAG: hypothetical protein R2762_01055 [Bryobacteraceae bacterium]
MRSLLLGCCLALAPEVALRQEAMPPCMCQSLEALEANREGMEAHAERRLKEASEAYGEALEKEPPRKPHAVERALMIRFAPQVLTHPRDPFPLKDAVAILHPNGHWIAYHMFWEDDIDFPDDNDPCDHEVMWVQLNEGRTRVERLFTYFHGRILEAPFDGAGPVRVVSQWGKHGTMPLDWKGLPIAPDDSDVERDRMPEDWLTLEKYNRATWEKLNRYGRQSQESPLARGWPFRFEGTWQDFIRFEKVVELAPVLKKGDMMMVSSLNNAVLDRHFLRYNFAAKTEWPAALCHRAMERQSEQ